MQRILGPQKIVKARLEKLEKPVLQGSTAYVTEMTVCDNAFTKLKKWFLECNFSKVSNQGKKVHFAISQNVQSFFLLEKNH